MPQDTDKFDFSDIVEDDAKSNDVKFDFTDIVEEPVKKK